MSKEVYVEFMKWPEGYGLSIANEVGGYGIAGACGGGVGHVVKRFRVNTDELIENIKKYSFKVEER